MKASVLPVIAALALAAGSVFADGGGGGGGGGMSEEPDDPAYKYYAAASASKDWSTAAAAMLEAMGRDPRNADFHNLYAYALRQGANPDLSLVFKHYNEALRLDVNHRGAHEYLGEVYLLVGNVAKAKEHLARLDKLCLFGCPEYRDLKKAISEYEGKKR